ncbi:MAG: hypothetical protein ABI555_07820 [Chloroflexota bacterium]
MRLPHDPIWIDALLPTILLRGVLLAFAPLAVLVFSPQVLQGNSPLRLWERWDAGHYLEIAKQGYGPPTDPALITFFPLTPALVALGSRVIEPLAAGMLVAFVATLASSAGIYRLIRLDYGRQTARLGALAISVFPTSFALIAPYSEGVFLAFVVWSFLFARTGRWSAAGVCALLASLARLQGVFLLPALAAEYWLSRRRIDRDAGWLLLGLGGPLIYLGINALTFGDPLFFLSIQKSVFQHTLTAPWVVLGDAYIGATAIQATESWATVYLAPFVAFVILALTLVWTLVGSERRPSYAIYTAVTFVSFTSLSWPISMPRYLIGVFPMFIAAGRLGRIPWLGPPLFVASALLLGIFLTLYVSGHWAF